MNCVVSSSEDIFIYIHFCLLFLGHSLFCCSLLLLLSKTEFTAQPKTAFSKLQDAPVRNTFYILTSFIQTHTHTIEPKVAVHPVLAKDMFPFLYIKCWSLNWFVLLYSLTALRMGIIELGCSCSIVTVNFCAYDQSPGTVGFRQHFKAIWLSKFS